VARQKPKSTKAVKATPPEIAVGMITAETFQAIARSCLEHLQANERILHKRREVEAVHQLRVAIRRLRAALSIFRDMLGDEESRRINDELRWAAQQLGDARDLDVYIQDTLEPTRKKNPEDQALADHAQQVLARRDRAYDEALAAIRSQRFQSAVRDTSAWVEGGRWLSAGGGRARIRKGEIEEFASSELSRRTRKVRKCGEKLAELDVPERHRLRIAVKKLRYAAEFLSPVFESKAQAKRAKALQKALSDLQDRLGLLNDIAVGESMFSELGGREGVDRLLPARNPAQIDKQLAAGRRAFEKFRTTDPFWRS
jgi:CHAD domain-containing protein